MSIVLDSAKQYIRETENLKLAHLVALELPGEEGVFAYFTDYFRNITYKGNTFAAGVIKRVGEVKQTKDFTIYRLPVQVSGALDLELDRMLHSKSFLNRKLIIYRVFLDEQGEILPVYQNNDTIIYFEGVIVSSRLDDTNTTDKGRSIITWNCANEVYALDNVNGRLTDDESHRGLVNVGGLLVPSSAAKKPEYQQDKGFLHSNKSVKLLAEYQTKEKKFKLKKRRAGGFRGVMGQKHYDMEEYWADVIREVDMDINLTAKYIPIVYGVQKVPGIPVFVDTDVSKPDEIWVVYAFCEGEIDGFLDLYFGDAPMICVSPLDEEKRACVGMKRERGDTIGALAPPSPRNAPSVHGQHYIYNDGNGPIDFWTFHGTPDQQAASVLVDKARAGEFKLQNDFNFGAEYWDESFRLLDTAYIVMKIPLNENRTSLPEVSAEVQGKKVKAYHADGTVTSDSTSLNLAWQTLDYLQSATYGAGLDMSRIDIISIQKCAELMDIVDLSYEQTWVPYWRYLGWTDLKKENRQIIQGSAILSTNDTVYKNIQALISQFDASLNIVGGRYTLTMEADAPVVEDIDEGDIINGAIQVSDNSMELQYNSIQASILDPSKAWGSNTITFFNKDFKKEDNGKDKKANVSFPFITNYYTARTRAEYYLKRSRYNRTVSFELPFKYLWLYPNAPITITKKRYKWDKKPFLIQDVTWMANGHVKVVAREYAKDVFINSPQVDNSTEQLPDIIVGILPPRDLMYHPTLGESKVGLNGTLSWMPSLTKRVAYYTIRYTGLLDPITVPAPLTDITRRIELPLYNLLEGNYTFEVRAISLDGEASIPATLTVNVNPSSVLTKVTNFRLVNRSAVEGNVFIGSEVQLAWDALVETGTIPDLKYHLVFTDPNTKNVIRDVTTTGLEYRYPLALNKEDYKTHNSGALGVYRDLDIRIRAEADNNIASLDWTYL